MKENPIRFNAPMVRAILAGQKTQTRRAVKDIQSGCQHQGTDRDGLHLFTKGPAYGKVRCPYGQPGDRLWVQEAWQTDSSLDGQPSRTFAAWPVRYEADGATLQHGAFFGNTNGEKRQARHMPPWASRILLEIISVRVERLQDISEADAIAEGGPVDHPNGTACGWFQQLWEQINGAGSCDANPWMWMVEFKVIKKGGE